LIFPDIAPPKSENKNKSIISRDGGRGRLNWA
jgi:hypothetical protein